MPYAESFRDKFMARLDNRRKFHYNAKANGVWRSLVSRLVRVQEASGSNPDTPTKNLESASAGSRFLLVWWDSKGRHQCAHWCKKVSGGHFFSPWENPLVSGRTPCGCGQKSNLSDLWNPIITPRRISPFPFLRPRPKCRIYKIPFLWYKEQSGFDPNYLM